jgi:hypothetical protein
MISSYSSSGIVVDCDDNLSFSNSNIWRNRTKRLAKQMNAHVIVKINPGKDPIWSWYFFAESSLPLAIRNFGGCEN